MLEYISPVPAVGVTPAPVGDYISPVTGEYTTPAPFGYIAAAPAVHAASGPVAEYILPAPAGDVAPAAVAEYITPAPMEFLEAALHEVDEVQCRGDFEELCDVARMSRKRLWRRVWHGCSSPSGASKSEMSWRRISKR